jgi:hypothetical protein
MSQHLDDRTGAPLTGATMARESYREWLLGHVVARDAIIVELQQMNGELALRVSALEALVAEDDAAPMTFRERVAWLLWWER